MSAKVTAESIPRVVAPYRFQWEPAQKAYVILYPEGMIKLNPSAGEILNLCDGSRDVAAVVRELQHKFGVADLERDVFNFLEVAHDNGWIRNE